MTGPGGGRRGDSLLQPDPGEIRRPASVGGSSVLLIRPDSNERDARALAAEGLGSWIDPYLQTTPTADPTGAMELLEAVAELGAADSPAAWLIATSPRAYPAWSQLVG
ncbi:MAG: hypothetical protein WCF04_11660, partial [Candidatus Nanopelagicales bacterium]